MPTEIMVRVEVEPDPATRAQLDRIERRLMVLTVQEGTRFMEIDDRLADLAAAENTNTSKLARLIADFEARGSLTQEQRDAFDALKAEIVGNADAIDAADPEAAPAPPADQPPADSTSTDSAAPASAGDGQPVE